MTKFEFERYTSSITQLVGYCKHFGFDDDDTEAIVDYCKIGTKSRLISPSEIESLVSYSNSLQLLPITAMVSASLLIDKKLLADKTISNALDDAIQKVGIESLICPSQDGSYINITVSSLSEAKVSLTTLPFTGKVIIKVQGIVELVGYYLEKDLDQYKDEMIERGFVLIDEKGLILKARYGLPIKI
ncbi:hypothetical protein LMH73_004545 [Vibrio splendidus]|nr:hypothetical protein [Vibrio splendidus]MCC4883297.1 hypothetical protein [Vibrio splendidus]